MEMTLEKVIDLVRKTPLEDFNKLREIVDKEFAYRRDEEEGKISPERAIEILRIFHDDFYNQEKDAYSQKELRNALRWILTKHEKRKDIESQNSADNVDLNV